MRRHEMIETESVELEGLDWWSRWLYNCRDGKIIYGDPGMCSGEHKARRAGVGICDRSHPACKARKTLHLMHKHSVLQVHFLYKPTFRLQWPSVTRCFTASANAHIDGSKVERLDQAVAGEGGQFASPALAGRETKIRRIATLEGDFTKTTTDNNDYRLARNRYHLPSCCALLSFEVLTTQSKHNVPEKKDNRGQIDPA